jgi:methyl-accepting chemotaxis protein
VANQWTFGKKLALGFSMAGLVLVVIAIVGQRNAHFLIEDAKAVAHTQDVRRSIARVLLQMNEAETGQRGFVIAGDPAYLAPYEKALSENEATLAELTRLTEDNSAQQRNIAALRTIIDAKVAEMKAVLKLRQEGGFEAASARVLVGHGKNAMDEIRKTVAQMDDIEAKLLVKHKREAEDSAQLTESVVLWGSILGVVLVGIIGFLITRSLGSQVGTAANRIRSSSAELQAAASQQASGAKEQATAMNEITTTISELLATSRQIAESAQRVAQIADQTAMAARNGDGAGARGQDSMLSIRRQVDMIVSNMLELGKKSQHIGTVLDIVAELAEQTNILSINATIEAAGAGEQGKRFAVVADEIRKLADRVGGSTKEIRTLIEDIRGAVNTTVMTTETASKAVDAGTRQFVDIATALKQIGALVTTTTDASREIELSTKQQATAVEQVNVAIANVAQATRESESSSAQTLQTSSELTGLSSELIRIVQPEAS